MEITARRVTVYEVNDKKFTNKKEAEKYVSRIALTEWADQERLCQGGEWSQEMVIDSMLDNKEKLLEIFKGLVECPSKQCGS